MGQSCWVAKQLVPKKLHDVVYRYITLKHTSLYPPCALSRMPNKETRHFSPY